MGFDTIEINLVLVLKFFVQQMSELLTFKIFEHDLVAFLDAYASQGRP